MVIRVNVNATLSARKRREDLIHVHVGGGSRARLVGIDREVIVVGSVNNLLRCSDNRICDGSIDNAELFVHERCCALDVRESNNLGWFESTS